MLGRCLLRLASLLRRIRRSLRVASMTLILSTISICSLAELPLYALHASSELEWLHGTARGFMAS